MARGRREERTKTDKRAQRSEQKEKEIRKYLDMKNGAPPHPSISTGLLHF
jgi:hypothetical protein